MKHVKRAKEYEPKLIKAQSFDNFKSKLYSVLYNSFITVRPCLLLLVTKN